MNEGVNMIFFETKDASRVKQVGVLNEFDTKDVSDNGEFEGYASTYGNVDQGGDMVVQGAFDESLRGKRPIDVKMFEGHYGSTIGVWTEFTSDTTGLYAKGRLLLGIKQADDMLIRLKAGAMNALSIGYHVKKGGSHYEDGVRNLTNLDLVEVSLVNFPMNERARLKAEAKMREAKDEHEACNRIKTIRDFEGFLRDSAGYGHAQAKMIAMNGFREMRIKTTRDFEEFLRDNAGYEPDQARMIAANGFKELESRDGNGSKRSDSRDENDEGMDFAQAIERLTHLMRT